MSKFQSTISTVAALASIFGAAAGWKLAQSNSDVPPSALDQKIEKLEQRIQQNTMGVPEKPLPEEQQITPQQQVQTVQTPQVLPPTLPAPPAPPEE